MVNQSLCVKINLHEHNAATYIDQY